MKRSRWWLFLVVFLLFIPQGCATPNKPLTLSNMQSVTSIQVARNESPCLLKKTAGSQAVAMSGMMFGAVGGALGAIASHGVEKSGGDKLARECALPDFSKLVLEGFVDRLQKDFPTWPIPAVLERPVGDEYKPSGSTHLLVLRVTQIQVDDSTGLLAISVGKMLDPAGQVVWEKGYTYKTSEYSRPTSLKMLEAENGKLLKQEFFFAAEKTVSDFMDHLKGVPPTANPPIKDAAMAQVEGS